MRALVRRWWRRPDHYYWLTALLAARGAQTFTCRLVAVATVGVGLIPVVMLASPSGAHGHRDVSIALAVAAVAVVLAVPWLRRSWPPRLVSAGYVACISFCIAAACLIKSNPIAGLVGTIAFAVIAGYIAMFHGLQLLIGNTVVAAVTGGVLAVRLGDLGDPVLAGCTVTLLATIYLLVPFICHVMVRLLGANEPYQEIDQLTGLPNRGAFYRRTTELFMARARVDDRYLVIASITLDGFSLLTGTGGQVAGDRAHVAIAQTLRETTRGDAIVARSGGADYLIADTFALADPTPLIERVLGAIATTPPRLTASVGVVCTPLRALIDLPSEEVIDELLEIATAAMGEARRAGGNQAHYVETEAPKIEERDPEVEEPW